VKRCSIQHFVISSTVNENSWLRFSAALLALNKKTLALPSIVEFNLTLERSFPSLQQILHQL
jgi:hypothetical protein